MSGNKSLHAANRAKNDEFYTELADIDKELRHYKHHFKNKTVYCNCDDPRVSNFFHYFSHNFETLGLKKLMATCYKSQAADLFSQNDSEQAVYLIYEGDKNGNRVPDPSEIQVLPLQGDGDFRSEECIALLKQADIVVTNPPFSLFREYVAQLVEYGKKFLIIGNKNAITYKEIFPLIKDDKMWLGVTPMGTDMLFGVPEHYAETLVQTKKSGSSYRIIDGEVKARAQACWFTNLDHDKRHEELILYKRYTSEEYPHYDNYDAVDVSKVAEIPCDFDGAMGVPITFLDKYNPEQFEIIKFRKGNDEQDLSINGKCPYFRVLIKRKIKAA
ncbi:TPA: adenine-specific methyltransferase EcoRI family protein [Neisseria subflava]|jgi:modification methylase ecoRI|uniref:adenine-specific methyltransferase EcoRI family protein n=1 Tax=Neisseria TaxID=482 RepID=UPI0008A13545|nr:adenine-specific methyltransferase EcoRI family protein [Neisseria sp. HMSC075C12]OFL29925.1 modification methylase [Neisseria sp. HMSC075C12]